MPKLVTADRLRELLDYNPITGIFVWKRARGLNLVGVRAGCITPRGGQCLNKFYYKIGVDNHRYYSHVLAYLWMTGKYPEKELDHEDGNGLNNKWSNLRLSEHAENGRHRNDLNRNNSSGYAGVSYHTGAKKWRARIMVDGKEIHIGFFNSKEDAAVARREKAVELHGCFAPMG